MTYTPTAAEAGTTQTVVYQVCNTAVTPNVCETATVSVTVPQVPVCIPDLNPAISVTPNNGIAGSREMVVVMDVKEVAGCSTQAGQEIRVSIAKVSDFTFNWATYTNATGIPEAAVTGLDNSDWTFTETATAWVWVFNRGTMNANEISKIGFKGIFNAGASSGNLDFTVTIRNGSGGETNTVNNVDYETVVYNVAP